MYYNYSYILYTFNCIYIANSKIIPLFNSIFVPLLSSWRSFVLNNRLPLSGNTGGQLPLNPAAPICKSAN